MANRAGCEKYILDLVEEILPGGPNRAIYKKFFARCNTKMWGEFMESLGNGACLRLIVPNTGKYHIDYQRNFDIARKRFNHEFWQQLVLTDPDTNLTFTTPIKYPVFVIPSNRHEQHITDKQSLPDRPKTRDALSGQVVGPGAAISAPEANILDAKGHHQILNEYFNGRGGDAGMQRHMDLALQNTGSVTIKDLKLHSTGVRANKTYNNLLKSMHLDTVSLV